MTLADFISCSDGNVKKPEGLVELTCSRSGGSDEGCRDHQLTRNIFCVPEEMVEMIGSNRCAITSQATSDGAQTNILLEDSLLRICMRDSTTVIVLPMSKE